MNKDYAKRLKTFSQENWDVYQKVLDDCQLDIIDCFGGLDTIIQLCLTHDQFATYTNKPQLDSFKRLMESKHINIDITADLELTDTIEMRDDDYNSIPIDKNANKGTKTVLSDLKDFYRHSITMIAYCSDNLYFAYLSKENAKYICYNVLDTKRYPSIMIAIGVLLALIGQSYWMYGGYDVIYYFVNGMSLFAAMILALSYILSANISIVTFILQTFDFWYKMYNLVIWIITLYFLNTVPSIGYFILSSTVIICVYFFLFLLDATSIKIKYKNMFIIVVAVYGTYVCLFVYLFNRDTQWNPFKKYNFEYTNVSFKGLFMATQSNLCLFVLKPILSQISRKIRKFIVHKQHSNKKTDNNDYIMNTSPIKKNSTGTKNVQASYMLYKRPHVHWKWDSRISNVSPVRLNSLSPTTPSRVNDL